MTTPSSRDYVIMLYIMKMVQADLCWSHLTFQAGLISLYCILYPWWLICVAIREWCVKVGNECQASSSNYTLWICVSLLEILNMLLYLFFKKLITSRSCNLFLPFNLWLLAERFINDISIVWLRITT